MSIVREYKEGKYVIHELLNGDKTWWVNGKRHREDGPAYDGAIDNYKAWFLDDKKYTEKKYIKEMRKRKLEALGL